MIYKTFLLFQIITVVRSDSGLNMLEMARDQKIGGMDLPSQVKISSGYINDQPEGSDPHNLFYYFVESQKGKQAPTVLYLVGGPGFDSAGFLIKMLGPLHLKNGLHLNKYGWHRFANLLLPDWPYGTGYSKADPSYFPKPEDFLSDASRFVTRWLKQNPEINSDIYLAGDSFSGLIIPALVKYVVTDLRKAGDSKTADRFKGVILEAPDISGRFDEKSMVLSTQLNHMATKKAHKSFIKTLKKWYDISPGLYILKFYNEVNKILNKSKRYAPKSGNYYDTRHMTSDNRKSVHLQGAFHHITSGYMLYHQFRNNLPYDDSTKWNKMMGVEGHLDAPINFLNLKALITGNDYWRRQDTNADIKWCYENDLKMAIYIGEYDMIDNMYTNYQVFKKFLSKKEYSKIVSKKWQQSKNGYTHKTIGKLHLALFHNTGHFVSKDRKKSSANFVRKFIAS